MRTLIKAKSKGITRQLDSLSSRNIPTMQVALRQWFDFTIKQVRSDISRKFKKDVTTSLTNWGFIEEQGKKILKPAALEIIRTGGQEAYKLLAIKGSFDVLNTNSVRAAEKLAAEMVTKVTKETKKAIRAHIADGIKEGKSMPKIGKELRSVVGLNSTQAEAAINYRSALKEKYPKLSAAELDVKTTKYRGKMLRQRGVTIARTETARAQNLGYVQGLEDVGVVEVEFEVHPDEKLCEECAALDGERYPIEEAGAVVPVHPNCRCAMLPVVGDKTVSEQLAYAPPDLPGMLASEEGTLPWKQYLNAHRGEKSNSAILYDFYKVRYESTGKLSSSGLKHLKAHAVKFEATSVKISKPIPGLGDLIKPIKPPVGLKPPTLVTEPSAPKLTFVPEPKFKVPVGATKFETAEDYRKALLNLEAGKVNIADQLELEKLLAKRKVLDKKTADQLVKWRETKGVLPDAARHEMYQAISVTRNQSSKLYSQELAIRAKQKVSLQEMRALLNEQVNMAGGLKNYQVGKFGDVADDILSWVPKKSLSQSEIADIKYFTTYKEKKYSSLLGEYSRDGHSVTMFVGNKKVFAHEFGHHLSYQIKGAYKKQSRFFKSRTAGDVKKKLPGFTDMFGKKDKFGKYSYYAGRVYKDGSIPEAISVGLEYVWKNPLSAAKKDPEWFNMIISALKKL